MEKNKIGIIAIIVILVLMLLGLTIGFIYTVNLIKTNITNTANITDTDKESSNSTENVYNLEDIAQYHLAESISSNLSINSSDKKQHIVILTLSLGLNKGNKKDKPAMKEYERIAPIIVEQEVVIRDAVIEILRAKTIEELQRLDSKSLLREEILTCLQELFSTNSIVDVYFGEFNYQ